MKSNICPDSLKISYNRQLFRHFSKIMNYKQISKPMECDNNMSNEDQELLYLCHLHNDYDNDDYDDPSNIQLNFGLDYKWDQDKDVSILNGKNFPMAFFFYRNN